MILLLTGIAATISGYSVDLLHLGKVEDGYANYAYTNCIKALPNETGTYSCKSLLETWTNENTSWKPKLYSAKNRNGTRDGGLCQLNSAVHKDFMKGKDFKDPYIQLDYCLEVWLDAKSKGVMPRYGHKKFDYKYNKSTIQRRINKRGLVKISPIIK